MQEQAKNVEKKPRKKLFKKKKKLIHCNPGNIMGLNNINKQSVY
jgi:hypothetical protein